LKDILLLTPPFTQLNTPYPATVYLKGFLNTKGIHSFQMDLGLEVILEMFSAKRLTFLFDFAVKNNRIQSDNAQRIIALRLEYLKTIEVVIGFLQGKNPTLARRIVTDGFLPEGSRFLQQGDLEWAFGVMGIQEKAKYLATLYLEDLSDFLVECIDENFGFSRYAERLGRSASSFDELYTLLNGKKTIVDDLTIEILEKRLKSIQPKLVGISVPFPGNLYSAFRCAQWIRKQHPEIEIVMGGGFPNTELRSLTDNRVFEFFHYITLDDGELPLELLISNRLNPTVDNPDFHPFKRTFRYLNGKVEFVTNSLKKDYSQAELGTPDYSDLMLDKYLSVIEVTNPMHSLWSDGRWNKLTFAHGCYWGKCTFCDGSLDYIRNFDPVSAIMLVDRMEELISKTGESGFHFVDEAAPPALMRAVAIEILQRNLTVTWWTNIRFEKSFTRDFCKLLKASGCIAVSGGLEVASDRLLALIEKGVTVEQVAQVADNFTEAGILVHAYLMYGFPSQTVQETVDSLEMVRQMFELGIIQSAFWHQFALTAHSPVGLNPSLYGVIPENNTITFANNDVPFKDKTGLDPDKFSFGLKKSLLNYMHDIGFELPLQDWFDFKIPRTTVKKDYIHTCLTSQDIFSTKPTSKVIWLGGVPNVVAVTKTKRGSTWEQLQLTFQLTSKSLKVSMDKDKGTWFLKVLDKLFLQQEDFHTFAQLKSDYEDSLEDFELFWYSKPINVLREHGLLVL